ncbi:glycoside hydrolase family 3 C-terminal domain-containing protein [Paenibacillus sp. IB182496]|uniref:Glycoside hydrolase family 3 C-terminal domain-containing protein n=1 Tax=Paenibacillus sabuli TaxID=2772509 RepID=A0A927GRL8_9BACL|nr:glycoside hydrolase family 3 N-terminal domain-containing protein [Paenibacillus sabuli]MBD2845789.1 glycoside hydrolase family 3 C-terminal domain-containing protein [Paenibacillus sabuli]
MTIYQDAGQSIRARVEDLIGRMTLREKVGQVNQHMYGWDAYTRSSEGEPELSEAFKRHVEWGGGMGALYGLFRADPWSGVTYATGIPTADSARFVNRLQRYVMEHTRLGIPVLLSEECPHGHQALDGTLLPVNLAVGATWNPELAGRAYAGAAAEIRARGAHLALVSALDIAHEPRWGRTEECYSEDPHLAARFTAAVVTGMQGAQPGQLADADKTAVILKHLAAQGACQGGHNAGPVPIGERELREIHLPGALAGHRAGAAGYMAAYNEIDGVPCHASSMLLRGVLRGEWGFDGIVMADGTAIDRLLALAGDEPGAAALALSAGVDISLWDKAFTTLEEAVRARRVSEHVLDGAVRRVLTLKFELGLFDRPYADEARVMQQIGTPQLKAINLQLARESAVLLRNEAGLLPLGEQPRRIAVIGPNADKLYHQLGDYTSVQAPGSGTTVLEGMRRQAPAGTEIVYAAGCGVRSMDATGIPEAVAAAEQAEVAVLVLGGSSARNFDATFDSNGEAIIFEGAPPDMDCGEGVDLAELRLGGVQEQLVEAIHRTGTPIVAVLIQGRPHVLSGIAPYCQAMLVGWYPGPEGGTALAEIVYGRVNPSGKLPVSLPRSAGQLPVYYNQKNVGRPRPYTDLPESPLYPFGYGLSYTRFAYGAAAVYRQQDAAAGPRAQSGAAAADQSALVCPAADIEAGAAVEVAVEVSNAGETAGAETVQLYIQASESGITRRRLELKAFRKVELAPGERTQVRFSLAKEELAIWNRDMTFAVEPCRVRLIVGPDAATAAAEAELRLV